MSSTQSQIVQPTQPTHSPNLSQQDSSTTNPKKKRSNIPVVCYNCSEFGHKSFQCPYPRRTKRCYNCHSSDHLSSECSQPRMVRCFRCNQFGHRRSDCPNELGRICFKCLAPGHVSGECPIKTVKRCYNCKTLGHLKNECPSLSDDEKTSACLEEESNINSDSASSKNEQIQSPIVPSSNVMGENGNSSQSEGVPANLNHSVNPKNLNNLYQLDSSFSSSLLPTSASESKTEIKQRQNHGRSNSISSNNSSYQKNFKNHSKRHSAMSSQSNHSSNSSHQFQHPQTQNGNHLHHSRTNHNQNSSNRRGHSKSCSKNSIQSGSSSNSSSPRFHNNGYYPDSNRSYESPHFVEHQQFSSSVSSTGTNPSVSLPNQLPKFSVPVHSQSPPNKSVVDRTISHHHRIGRNRKSHSSDNHSRFSQKFQKHSHQQHRSSEFYDGSRYSSEHNNHSNHHQDHQYHQYPTHQTKNAARPFINPQGYSFKQSKFPFSGRNSPKKKRNSREKLNFEYSTPSSPPLNHNQIHPPYSHVPVPSRDYHPHQRQESANDFPPAHNYPYPPNHPPYYQSTYNHPFGYPDHQNLHQPQSLPIPSPSQKVVFTQRKASQSRALPANSGPFSVEQNPSPQDSGYVTSFENPSSELLKHAPQNHFSSSNPFYSASGSPFIGIPFPTQIPVAPPNFPLHQNSSPTLQESSFNEPNNLNPTLNESESSFLPFSGDLANQLPLRENSQTQSSSPHSHPI